MAATVVTGTDHHYVIINEDKVFRNPKLMCFSRPSRRREFVGKRDLSGRVRCPLKSGGPRGRGRAVGSDLGRDLVPPPGRGAHTAPRLAPVPVPGPAPER